MIIQYLVRFYQEADLALFSKMMAFVVPHGGEDYVQGKYTRFRASALGWMCDLTPTTLGKFQEWLEIRYSLVDSVKYLRRHHDRT